MQFETLGNPQHPAVLFFHAMGVTGASSVPVARCLQDRYFCILPTATVYCAGQKYRSKSDEVRQIVQFLHNAGVNRLALVVASSIGADLALAFLTQTALPVDRVFFDGGQFAQMGRVTRPILTPLLYAALKSLYRTNGKTLRAVLWCGDDAIKPYFIAAGKALRYGNLRRQLADSLVNRPLPPLPESLQQNTWFAFGSAEDHFKYRPAVMRAYPRAHFPVFDGCNHMQYQIRDPQRFAEILRSVAETNALPEFVGSAVQK